MAISSRFSPRPFAIFIAIFAVEVFIAIFVRDRFVRPLLGDVLVVALVFYLLKAFFVVRNLPLALGTLVFAWAIEIAQYFNIVEVLGLGNVKIARVVIGSTFDWKDLIAYTLGAIAVFGVESRIEKGIGSSK